MRLVATSDTHFPVKKSLVPDGDVLIFAGDLMYTGYLDEWYTRIDALAELPHKTKLFIAGNHDLHLFLFSGPACAELRERGITVVGEPLKEHKHVYKLSNGMVVLGMPYVNNLPLWAFNKNREWLAEYIRNAPAADIIVSHSPVHGILDYAPENNEHYGIRAYKEYLQRHRPEHWISGHIHESYGEHAQDGCLFYNVSMCNRNYQQVNPAIVIDI